MSNPRTALVLAAVVVFAGLWAVPTAKADSTAKLAPGADSPLASGETFWQGQQLAVDASGLSVDGSLAIWRVTGDGRLNQRVGTVNVGDDGTAVVDTASLEGRYVLRAGDTPIYVQDGTAYTSNPPDGTTVTVDAGTFQVTRQTLSIQWSDPSVYPGQTVTLTVESNRQDSLVALSGHNLTFQDLTTLIPSRVYADNYDARSNDSALLIDLGRSTSFRLNTTVLEPGEGSLDFDVVDTTGEATPALTVNAPGEEAHFRSVERRDQIGDVIDATIACSHCFLVVGGPGQGLLDVVELTDTTGDGNVTLHVNTRYAGMARGQADFPNEASAYTSPDDDVHRYSSSATLESISESLLSTTASLDDLRAEFGLAESGRRTPIEPSTIRLTLATSDYLLPREDYGDRPPTGSPLVVKDETDVETIQLTPWSFDGVQSMAAPAGGGQPQSGAELAATVGPRNPVALGDRLVFRIDVSGIYGYLAVHGTSLETIRDNPDEGFRLRLRRIPGGEGTPEPVELPHTAARVVADPAHDDLYLTVETGGTAGNRLQAGTYRAVFELDGVDEKYPAYAADTATAGFPYLDAGETRRETAAATVADPVGSITGPIPGSGPNLTTAGALVVEGQSSIAPGAEVTVTAGSTEYAWETQATVEMDQRGNWSTGLNLTAAPGREFEVTLRRGDDSLASQTYTVYPPAEGAKDSGGDGGGSSGGGGGAAGVPDGGTTIPILGIQLPDLSGLAGLAVPVGGGIGALAVVWISWKLVIRRILL